jgi:hypothetical protein
MSVVFKGNDKTPRVAVKFIPAYLPEAKKPFYAKVVHQRELDIHDVASKAEVYNIQESPEVIEKGLTAGLDLILYLVASGYTVKTSLFTMKMRIPGEYDGTETGLPEGVRPEARLQAGPALRSYVNERVTVEFDGKDISEGIIAELYDNATGLFDTSVTPGNLAVIRGAGLKIEADEAHQGEEGLFLQSRITGTRVKAEIVAVNEPRTLKFIVPPGLNPSQSYFLLIITQSSTRGSGHLIKELREIRSDFNLTVTT